MILKHYSNTISVRPKPRLDEEAINEMADQLINIDKLEGKDFENYLADLFVKLGYVTVEVTEKNKRGNDGGIDLYVTDGNGIKTAVQAKGWSLGSARVVGVRDVRELNGVISCHENGAIITSHLFSPGAIKEAKEYGIELIDREGLIKLISLLEPRIIEKAFFEVITAHMGKCPDCGSILLNKKFFIGCSRFPVCEYKKDFDAALPEQGGLNGKII